MVTEATKIVVENEAKATSLKEVVEKLIKTPLPPSGIEINNTNIRIWIHDKDLESLDKVLWEGEGFTLIKHTSGHAKIRKFLDAVPRLMVKIKCTIS